MALMYFLTMINFLRANATIVSLIIAIVALVQPWIIFLWKKFFRAPKVEIYQSENIEIGYSDYGPTIALHGTLRAPHGDVFVKSVRLKTKRVETKEEHLFAWALFRSPVITFNAAEPQPMELPASFIISQTQPRRFNIFFYDPNVQSDIWRYLENVSALARSIVQVHNLNFSRGAANRDFYTAAHDAYFSSPDEIAAYGHVNAACYWQVGRYELEVHVDTNMKDSHCVEHFAFQLAGKDVESLRSNAVVMMENLFRRSAGEQLWTFNFVYAPITKIR